MAMGNGNTPQLRQSVLYVANVGDNQVDATLPFLGELASGVDEDQVIPILDRHHALADLADSSQGNHPQPAVCSFAGTLLGGASPASRVLWRRRGVTSPARPGARRPLRVALRSSPWARPGRALPRRARGVRLIGALFALVRRLLSPWRSRASL